MTAGTADTSRWSGNLARPLQHFLHTEAGSSSLLLGATIVALVWANSPLRDSYVDLWHTKATIAIGSTGITQDLRHWVNDGLMVFFFYVVGLEIRRELTLGELRDRREAAVPAIAALGGMAVPAVLFLAINAGGEGAHGWGIVMATDIAFVLGALALMGPRPAAAGARVPAHARDRRRHRRDHVIALFYSEDIDLVALAAAVGHPRRNRAAAAAGARLARPGLLRRGPRAVGRDARVRRAPDDRGRPAGAGHRRATRRGAARWSGRRC